MSSTTQLPPDLEKRLSEFLELTTPMRSMMRSIAEWHHHHDAEHQRASEAVAKELASHSFRITSLEAAAGRGWWGVARVVVIVLLAASGGYGLRAATAPPPNQVPAIVR